MRQGQTSCDKARQGQTRPGKLRPVGQDTLTGSWDRQGTLAGSCWDFREAASQHHNAVSQGSGTFGRGPGTFSAVSEGSGTFRDQRQTTGIDAKMTEIMKIVENGLRRLEMG